MCIRDRMAGLSVCIYIVVLPLLIIDSRKKGRFMGGAVAAFLVGYACLFFKTGILRSVYPVSAALTVVGFDMAEYTGTASQGNRVLAVLVPVSYTHLFGSPAKKPTIIAAKKL